MTDLKRDVGNWVVGERFWNRKEELRLFIELLKDGANVLLVAPRRVGKTSLMREAARKLDADDHVCLFVDLQKSMDATDAMVELGLATRPHLGLWARTKEALKNTLAHVDAIGIDELSIKLRDGFSADWQSKGDRFFDGIAGSEKPVVVFLDELPILVNRLLKGEERQLSPERIRKADMFVSFLRAQTIKHRGKIRFVVAGSIGLAPVLRQAGLSATINTFTPFELLPWDAHVAIGCIEALARGDKLTLDDGVPQRMVALLGSCVPHHVQMFFSHLYMDARKAGVTRCSKEDVDRVFRTSMLSARGHAELSHLEERLSLVLSPTDLPLALDLLTEAAVSSALTFDAALLLAEDDTPPPEGAPDPALSRSTKERIRNILEIFEHDGYLERDGDRYVFVSRLVQSWWRARFELGYTRAADRRRPS